ncbi:PilZ domain-containing protein [Candidatus Omnitrophota bacterium]
MKERRKFVRLNIPLEVSYTIQGTDQDPQRSVTKNISPNGASFTVEEDSPKGTMFDINIRIPEQAEPIPIKAKIVWSQKEAEQEQASYNAGFEFIQIPENSKQMFFQYLCNFMYDQFKKL